MLCCAGFLSSTDLRYRLVCLLNDSVAFLFVFVFDASDFHLAMTTIMLQAHSVTTKRLQALSMTTIQFQAHSMTTIRLQTHSMTTIKL